MGLRVDGQSKQGRGLVLPDAKNEELAYGTPLRAYGDTHEEAHVAGGLHSSLPWAIGRQRVKEAI